MQQVFTIDFIVYSLCCAHLFGHRLTRFHPDSSENGALTNNFVDAQFLQAVWPQELDDVRLLIITVVDGGIMTHDWNLFTPKPNVQAAIDSGEEWAGRDVILKLENGHFTILRAKSQSEHPVQDLLNMIGESKGTEAPGERQLLHLESIFGGQPDPTRPRSVLQLYADVFESAEALPSVLPPADPPASESNEPCSALHPAQVSSAQELAPNSEPSLLSEPAGNLAC